MARKFSDQFYHSKIWKEKRKEILNRDKYTCADCFGRATEVHHKTELTPENINIPRIALGNDNLMSLCHDCHTKRTLKRTDVNSNYKFDDKGFLIKIN